LHLPHAANEPGFKFQIDLRILGGLLLLEAEFLLLPVIVSLIYREPIYDITL